MSEIKKLIHDVVTTHGATMDREGLINVFEYVEELEQSNKTLSNNHFQQIEQHKRMAKQINRYKQVLEFYADKEKYFYKSTSLKGHPVIIKDGGAKARQELKENRSEHVSRS